MTQIIAQSGMSDPTASFGSNTLPDFDNVLGEWWLGGTLADSVVNQITGVSGTVFGSPSVTGGYMTVATGDVPAHNGIETDIVTPSNLTVVALVRRIAGKLVAFGNPNSMNWTLSHTSTKIGMDNGAYSVNTDQAYVVPETPPLFTFVMGVSTLGNKSKIYKVTEAGTTQDEAGATSGIQTTRPNSLIRIGGGGDVNNTGIGDIAAFAVIEDVKGQSYAEALYPMWRAYAQSRGITVA